MYSIQEISTSKQSPTRKEHVANSASDTQLPHTGNNTSMHWHLERIQQVQCVGNRQMQAVTFVANKCIKAIVHQGQTMEYRHYTHVGNGTRRAEFNIQTTNTSKQSLGIQCIAQAAPTTEIHSASNKHAQTKVQANCMQPLRKNTCQWNHKHDNRVNR